MAIYKRKKLTPLEEVLIHKKFNYTCQWCEKNCSHNSCIHHVNSNPSDNSEKNLILLCTPCHHKFHGIIKTTDKTFYRRIREAKKGQNNFLEDEKRKKRIMILKTIQHIYKK
jgi:hypothetical protein